MDAAGVWWVSMSFGERIGNPTFVQNQKQIESDWDTAFGDRKNELVFIGQYLEKEKLREELNSCLLTETEVEFWKNGLLEQDDQWPIPVYN